MSSSESSRIRHHRMVAYWLLSLLVLTLVLPLIPYAIAGIDPFAGQVANPGTELWRDVRQRDGSVAGSTQVKGVDSGILINTWGEDWRKFRMQQLIPYGAALMGIVLAIILLYYLVHGPLHTHGERDDRKIQRFTVYERTTHWFTVGLFWLLGLTGLILLYGRYVLIPLLGPEGFAVTASACKEAHNLFGPLFLVALFLLFIRFAAKNIPKRRDLTWLRRGGGAIGEGHVSSGFFNAGEKIWFWAVIVLGLTVSISGLILDFPIFAQGRETMQLTLIVHGITAVLLTAGSLAHIYIGTIGSEGSLESMTTGYVDENWAEAHHDLWYAEMMERGETVIDQKEGKQETPPMNASPDKA